MPPTKKATGKRPATTPVTDDGEAKRLRSVIDETVDEFICALTYELPLDPVTAEDGKIYERAAITEWLKKHKKSPLTNEEMGTKLLPAHQVKNMIEKLVRSGAISGDKAEGWQKRVKEQDELRELREGWALPVRPTKIPQSPMFDAPSRDRSIVAQGRP